VNKFNIQNISKRILITGGCGFIGVNLVNYLIKNRFDYIRILDNLSIGTKENLKEALKENGKITLERETENFYRFKISNNLKEITIDLIIGDIRSYEICLEATKDIDIIVHLAAHAGVIPSIEDPFYDFNVNAYGTLNLLHASVKNKIDKFIFASSNAPLGDQNPPLAEEKLPKPLSPYGASKLACEGYCSAFYNSYGLKTVILRFSNVYGPFSLHKNSVIAKFIKDGILKRELTIYGDGNQTRDFIHVKDICEAIYLALNCTSPFDQIWGTPFHLGTGRETSVLKLAELVKGFVGDKIKISFAPERKGEIKRNYSDISKAEAVLGFRPSIKLEEGVKGVYEWFSSLETERIKNAHVFSGSE
jgi:UDP-glucose 4-epimerase